MRHIATDNVVCLLVTLLSPAKTVDQSRWSVEAELHRNWQFLGVVWPMKKHWESLLQHAVKEIIQS